MSTPITAETAKVQRVQKSGHLHISRPMIHLQDSSEAFSIVDEI